MRLLLIFCGRTCDNVRLGKEALKIAGPLLQVFGQPSFEVIEYLLMDDTASLLSVKNCLARFFGSLVYVITLSFLAALLPGALPNVASVIGAVCYVSLVRPNSPHRNPPHSWLAVVQRAAHCKTLAVSCCTCRQTAQRTSHTLHDSPATGCPAQLAVC